MLSHDELTDGMIFVLSLSDETGGRHHWVETLRGDVARRWHDIYRRSNWDALRAEAAGVFRRPATDAEAAAVLKARVRRIVIRPPAVRFEELATSPAAV